MFFKVDVLKDFAKFTRKNPCWSLFLIKLQIFRPATLLKRDSHTGFSCKYCETFINSNFEKQQQTTGSECTTHVKNQSIDLKSKSIGRFLLR